MEKVFLDISREEELSETVRNFQFCRLSTKKGLKKKMLWIMHGMESQWRWNLFKSVIILILNLSFHFVKLSYSFSLTQ